MTVGKALNILESAESGALRKTKSLKKVLETSKENSQFLIELAEYFLEDGSRGKTWLIGYICGLISLIEQGEEQLAHEEGGVVSTFKEISLDELEQWSREEDEGIEDDKKEERGPRQKFSNTLGLYWKVKK